MEVRTVLLTFNIPIVTMVPVNPVVVCSVLLLVLLPPVGLWVLVRSGHGRWFCFCCRSYFWHVVVQCSAPNMRVISSQEYQSIRLARPMTCCLP